MKWRCKNHERYIKRGITFDPAWENDFDLFVTQVGLMPSTGLTLDRINNEKGYFSENVRWATRTQQQNNRGSYNKMHTWHGLTRTTAQRATLVEMHPGVLEQRMRVQGWSFERALLTPVKKYKPRKPRAPAQELQCSA